jgi:membrane protein DedA with SNARE-associated domain
MPLVSFTIYTTAGSLVWNSVMIGLGYALGERWERILEYADYLQYVVLVAIAVGLLYIAWYLLRRRPAAT